MADDFVIRTHEIDRVAAQVKAAGDRGLRLSLQRNLRAALLPVIPKLQQSARENLPSSGGLAERVAASKISTSVSLGRVVRVSVRARGQDGAANVRRFDEGKLRHPVFGNREVWVDQAVRPGWFTKTMEEHVDVLRAAAQKAVDDVARDIEKSGRGPT